MLRAAHRGPIRRCSGQAGSPYPGGWRLVRAPWAAAWRFGVCFCGVLGRVWGVRTFWLIVAGQVFLWVAWFYLMWSPSDGAGPGVLLVLGTLGIAGLAFGVGGGSECLWPRRKWLGMPVGLVTACLGVSLWIALLGGSDLAALWWPVVAPLLLALELASCSASGYDTGLR